MTESQFTAAFNALTGNNPFPWQAALYQRFIADRPDHIPKSCNLPTGLGKTSVIAIWLLALISHPVKMPRRLVYVVNRRTVVDQTTNEVEKVYERIHDAPELLDRLRSIGTDRVVIPFRPQPLAISTLRGQFADNREWSADPSRPAVICGTVDMIGSRLLFSGYGVGFKSKPLHAGFLGQDVLLVHDEAHLEPAFQKLLIAIENEQQRCKDFCPLRVMELTATSRGAGDVFELTPEEKAIPATLPEPPTEPIHRVWQRMKSRKGLKFEPEKRDAVAKRIGELARDRWKTSGKAVIVFVRTIDDVKSVHAILADKKNGVGESHVQKLTGTMRGLERDTLATHDPVFARFMPEPKVTLQDGTVYLICTSAGEVGVDISADHMVCDLSTLDSMAQRFGRVNRRGEGEAQIDVVYETDPNPKPKSPEFESARWQTKAALERLAPCDWIDERYDASPAALGVMMRSLTEGERDAAFAPKPTILPTSDILFDSWALTTIKGKLSGRPMVEPYLHGVGGWEPPETHFAWREEVEKTVLLQLNEKELGELLDDFALKPHELLREPSYRAFNELVALAKRHPEAKAWLLDDDGNVKVHSLEELADKDEKERIEGQTVILPPNVGGLEKGLFNGASPTADDVSCEWFADKERLQPRRARKLDDPDPPSGMRSVRTVELRSPDADDETEPQLWYWFARPQSADDDGSKTSKEPIRWQHHTDDVEANATLIVNALFKDRPDLHRAVVVAAKFHDLGKQREVWQRSIGNPTPKVWFAKSGKDPVTKKMWRSIELTDYRHEFGSLLDLVNAEAFKTLSDDQKELVLHLVAVHHGYGRPHFPAERAFDPNHGQDACEKLAAEVPQRFARLQRKYGRWGLAYLESLLRAADWAASSNPSAFVEGHS